MPEGLMELLSELLKWAVSALGKQLIQWITKLASAVAGVDYHIILLNVD